MELSVNVTTPDYVITVPMEIDVADAAAPSFGIMWNYNDTDNYDFAIAQ